MAKKRKKATTKPGTRTKTKARARKPKSTAHPASTRPGLTPKEDRFVDEYLIDLNGGQAAKRAGYGTGNPRAQAHQLLQKPAIRKALAAAAEARRKRTEATQDRVLEELGWLAYSRIQDYEIGDSSEPVRLKPGVPEEAMRAISSIKSTVLYGGEDVDSDAESGGGFGTEQHTKEPHLVKTEFRLWPKDKALALLMRHLGMYKEKQEVDLNAKVHLYMPDNGRE